MATLAPGIVPVRAVPGVYFVFRGEGSGRRLVYIGESADVPRRLARHTKVGRAGDRAYYWPCASKRVRQDVERELIRQYRPPLNVAHVEGARWP